ncbi:MAG: helix-turn-helix transcriptional regulator [Candidatus Woykebacteria bacterium]
MVTKDDVKLGRTIRKLRKEAGLTQEELAEKAKISTTYIGYIEIGQKKPALSTLSRIASALKVKVKDLIPY